MNKQCFGYTRVSTAKQGEGASLEAQREAIERYADQHNIAIIQWLEEKETAAKQGRPIFTAMIKDLHAKKADGVVMHKIDRSARNLRDWAAVGELQDAGIDVHFAAESVDFASRGGRLTADIQAVIAADYIRNLKDEIRKGQVGRLKQGIYPFSAPFGYLDAGKGNPKAIDPVRGPYVREMFERYATGEYSLPSLEQELHRRGYRTSGGHKIYKSKIELILANPFYMGVIKLKKHPQPYEGAHQALISPQLFQRVQEVKRDRSRRKKTKHSHTYRGVFKCNQCGNSMIPERQKGHVYYRCQTKGCPPNSIRQNVLEWSVLKQLSYMSLIPSDAQNLRKRMQAQFAGKSKVSKAEELRLKLANIETQIERLNTGYLEGLFDAKTLREKKSSYEFRKLELSKQVQFEQSDSKKEENTQRFLEHLQSLARTYFFAKSSEKRQMLNLLFSNMTVEAKNVDIQSQNWVCWGQDIPASLSCADRRVRNRSDTDSKFQASHDLIKAFEAPQVAQLNNLLDPIVERSKTEELPEGEIPHIYDEAA